ncbi:MAG: argininosuccinate lyase [Thermomicrobiales bacterium]
MSSELPHPAYADHVLRPAFDDARRLLFGPMLAANAAHLVMLAETGIVAKEDAARALVALREIEAAGPDAFAYAPSVEDLFFAVEGRLIGLAGPDAGGNLQIARSRNDLDAVMCRLMLRDRVLSTIERVDALRERLLALAEEHVETLMPGTTHTQPAQPTTLAHYLGGVLGPLERDAERLRQLYARVNRCPLGAAAFTTTGFPINRERTARLLGFEGIVENGYDAVGASDHMLEATGALVTMSSSLSRFVYDLLIWARPEVGIIRISDEFVQISSIMPQKRNPVVLEHVRARIGYVYGDAATVATMVHSSAYGDTVDVEDEIYVPLARCLDAAASVLDLLTAVFATIGVDRDLLAARAGQGFTTSTELADTLVRRYGLPFRTAHAVAGKVVKAAIAEGKEADSITVAMVEVAARSVIGQTIGIDEATLRNALDPWQFVRSRAIPGGPAPEAMRRYLSDCRGRLYDDRRWLAGERERLMAADAERSSRAERLPM